MMLALVNGMDAVNYKQFRTSNVYFVDQIMLSNGMDAVSSLLWIHNFIEFSFWGGGGEGGGGEGGGSTPTLINASVCQ